MFTFANSVPKTIGHANIMANTIATRSVQAVNMEVSNTMVIPAVTGLSTQCFNEQTTPDNPGAGKGVLFVKDTVPTKLAFVDDVGNEIVFVGTSDSQALTNKTLTATSNDVAAKSLHSATTVVNVSAATAPTSGQVLTATSSTTATWQPPAASGETNTASNVGVGGVGVFKQKTGVNLEFRNINAGSNKVTITNDSGNNEIDVDVAPANITIGSLSGAPSGTVVGTSDSQALTNKTLTDTSNNVAAKSLHSATTVVDVSAATAPTSGQVLTATSGTAATWQSPAATTLAAVLATGNDANELNITNLGAVTFDTAGPQGIQIGMDGNSASATNTSAISIGSSSSATASESISMGSSSVCGFASSAVFGGSLTARMTEETVVRSMRVIRATTTSAVNGTVTLLTYPMLTSEISWFNAFITEREGDTVVTAWARKDYVFYRQSSGNVVVDAGSDINSLIVGTSTTTAAIAVSTTNVVVTVTKTSTASRTYFVTLMVTCAPLV